MINGQEPPVRTLTAQQAAFTEVAGGVVAAAAVAAAARIKSRRSSDKASDEAASPPSTAPSVHRAIEQRHEPRHGSPLGRTIHLSLLLHLFQFTSKSRLPVLEPSGAAISATAASSREISRGPPRPLVGPTQLGLGVRGDVGVASHIPPAQSRRVIGRISEAARRK